MEKDNDTFKLVANVCRMGDVICDTLKEKNAWKLKMLRAGLENQGLIMPEDWDQLSEEDKQKRLDGVLKVLNEKQ